MNTLIIAAFHLEDTEFHYYNILIQQICNRLIGKIIMTT